MKKTLYLLLTKLVLFTVNAYGNVLYTFDLSRSNTIQIQDGKICVQAAECLDETCGVYCNHCQPCPAELNVGLINKYYDLVKTEEKGQ